MIKPTTIFINENFFETVIKFQIVSKQSNFKSKIIHNFKTVNPRQILLAEVSGKKGFFKVKVLSDFYFRDFWKTLSQHHLETKLLWTKFCLGDNQFISIV